MITYAIKLAYDGNAYCGWQTQPNGDSIQSRVQNALKNIFGQDVIVTGSGRTDAGVHALGQVASFQAEKEFAPYRLRAALNAHLPNDIRVVDSLIAPNGFNARKSARKKTYMYRWYLSDELIPTLNAHCVKLQNANIKAMHEASINLIGTHNFSAFVAAGGSAKTFTRTVYNSRVIAEHAGGVDFIEFIITANGFLYNMVRIIAAYLERIAACTKSYKDIIKEDKSMDLDYLLTCKDRTYTKLTAPPHGLYLMNVEYENIIFGQNLNKDMDNKGIL